MKYLNKVFNYLIAFGLIAFGVFFYLKNKGYFQKKELQVSQASSLDTDRLVNQHLQETNRKMLRDKADPKQAIEAALRDANKLKEKPEPSPQSTREATGLAKFQNSQAEKNLKQQLKNQPQTLSREEYARQYIENARRDGFEIELSEDLEVIRATPIRQPSQEIDMVEISPSN